MKYLTLLDQSVTLTIIKHVGALPDSILWCGTYHCIGRYYARARACTTVIVRKLLYGEAEYTALYYAG